ncbi:MAG: SUMF1/EgtB/PvdO family nonheme iron enzyme, partial [Gammaproteobacteria bacterium]|nr:SUMF1/EgtB/PvdO family nonheme iron enzyme [Gammaproteobacteria bacterium]
EPAGAEIRVDGNLLASTPETVEILEGERALEISMPGFKTIERSLQVVAGENQSLPAFELQKSDGRVALDSRPRGASVTIGGVYRGQTPLSLALAPGREYPIQFSRAGYRKVTRRVAVRSGEGRSLSVDLEPEQGTIRVSVNPAAARVLVNGKPVGSGDQTLTLPSVPHRVRVELAGYAPYAGEITPRPGFEQNLEVSLRTEEQARYDALAATIDTAAGQTLRLIRPGSLRMGASRREPGRRANEVIRAVLLTRPFYIATTEVTNEQFKRFEPRHESGIVGRTTLNLDKAPVVNISWEQAARYCNWLSERDGLSPVYREQDGELVAARPVGTGYRLATEAEWVWAARGNSRSKYPWGETMPPAAKSGNFADDSALPVVARVIAGFNDGHIGTAPAGSFPPNDNGLHDFAGNVAEWVHDFYAVNPSPGGGAETDPLGPAGGDFHVVRGSSWKHSTITALRWSFRDYSAEPRNDIGFRIARYAD